MQILSNCALCNTIYFDLASVCLDSPYCEFLNSRQSTRKIIALSLDPIVPVLFKTVIFFIRNHFHFQWCWIFCRYNILFSMTLFSCASVVSVDAITPAPPPLGAGIQYRPVEKRRPRCSWGHSRRHPASRSSRNSRKSSHSLAKVILAVYFHRSHESLKKKS